MSSIKNKLGMAAIAVAVVGSGVGIYKVNHPAPDPIVMGDMANPTTKAISEVAAGKAVLIDVRTPAEFASGHAKGAINFDSVNVEAGQLPDVAKNAKVYLYCHSGRRAGIVLSIMQKNNFTDVTNLGALQDWLDAGGPKS